MVLNAIFQIGLLTFAVVLGVAVSVVSNLQDMFTHLTMLLLQQVLMQPPRVTTKLLWC